MTLLSLSHFNFRPDLDRHQNGKSDLDPHCKDTVPKIRENIPRKKTARPQSQFLHSYSISVSDLYILMIGLPIWLKLNRWTDPENI